MKRETYNLIVLCLLIILIPMIGFLINYFTEYGGIRNVVYPFVKAHNYERNVYDCDNFSRDLGVILNESGFESYTTLGYVAPNCSLLNKSSEIEALADEDWDYHMWLKVNIQGKVIDVEATTGSILSDEQLELCYKQEEDGWRRINGEFVKQ